MEEDFDEESMQMMQGIVMACQNDDVKFLEFVQSAGFDLKEIKLLNNTTLLHMTALAGSPGYGRIASPF